MPRAARSTAVRSALCLAALGVAATSCTSGGTVSVRATSPSPDAQGACTALIAKLGQTVDGLAKRKVSPASPYTAAWGDPAVTLRCGVAVKPADAHTAAAEINGVAWQTHELGDVVQWVTDGRTVGVELRVPLTYTSQENVLSAVGDAVTATVPASSQTPAVDAPLTG